MSPFYRWFLREFFAAMLLIATGTCVGLRAFAHGSLLVGMLGCAFMIAWMVLIVFVHPRPPGT